jgi:predicted metallopeptidase
MYLFFELHKKARKKPGGKIQLMADLLLCPFHVIALLGKGFDKLSGEFKNSVIVGEFVALKPETDSFLNFELVNFPEERA